MEFKNLKTSTQTVVAYTNIVFDRDVIFQNIMIDQGICKGGSFVKKNLSLPAGVIVNIQKGVYIRGLVTRKPKQHWCPSCKLTETVNGKEKKITSVKEHYVDVTEYEPDGPFTLENFKPHIKISYHCSSCNIWYTTKQIHKYPSFLNQNTIYISIGDVILNVMLFKNIFKIAGCRSRQDAIDVCTILWGVINSIEGSWSINRELIDSGDAEKDTSFSAQEVSCAPAHQKMSDPDPKIVLDPVMQNIDFFIGYKIDRYALNVLMNSEELSDYISSCIFEPTSDTNVQIRIKASKPEDHMYDVITLKYKGIHSRNVSILSDRVILKEVPVWGYKMTKESSIGLLKTEKKLKQENITIIVFGSGQTIMSGRYIEDMKNVYERFKSILDDHRDIIEDV